MLTPGEVVISKPAAQKFGVGKDNLLAINARLLLGRKSKTHRKKPCQFTHNEGGVDSMLDFLMYVDLIKALVGTAETTS